MRISDCSSDVCSSDLQACPSADSSPTWLELRHVRNTAQSVSRSRSATQRMCSPVWIAITTTSVTSAEPIRSTPSSSAVASFTAIAASANIDPARSEEHTSELQSLMRISYAVFCLKKKNNSM